MACLSAASSSFRRLFDRMVQQNPVDASGGHKIVGMRCPDGVASLLILIAIHGRQPLLPQSNSPMLLTQVTTNANQYGCSDAIAPLCRPWIDQAIEELHIPTTIHRTLEVWIGMASTFRHQRPFNTVTLNWIISARD
ncbi:hypothetical protein BJX68DRAFT_270521 [Aspergillus pseudodeflectus]|uniref:BTB domain-containing protein n=1 Tax=Aspergillus pseudodeflectus TaxID=176178 RepID=A0ABR4JS14_9EURO